MDDSRRLSPNDLLRHARLRTPSPSGSGRSMSRQELADAVNTYVAHHDSTEATLDANQIGKMERGHRRWPGKLRRDGFRHALGADSDQDLGFYIVRGMRTTDMSATRPSMSELATPDQVENRDNQEPIATRPERWSTLLDDGDARRGHNSLKRSDLLRIGGALAATTTALLFAGLPVDQITERDCAQWLAWNLWQRRATRLHGSELPAPVLRFLDTRDRRSAASSVVLCDADGCYAFAHPSLIDFYIAQRIFNDVAVGDSKLFATVQTSHDTDLVIREFLLRSENSANTLRNWMRGAAASSPVLRVNSAGVLAKLGSGQLTDEVIRTLKADSGTRNLYITAVISRVLQLPWNEAERLAASIEHEPSRLPEQLPVNDLTRIADRFAAETSNPRDGAARWCGVVVLDHLKEFTPTITSDALHIALRQEKNTETIRSIAASLVGDSPLSY